jgi:hypothetical protein
VPFLELAPLLCHCLGRSRLSKKNVTCQPACCLIIILSAFNIIDYIYIYRIYMYSCMQQIEVHGVYMCIYIALVLYIYVCVAVDSTNQLLA